MNNKLVIDHHINKQAEGTYYTIPFAVPDAMEQIMVSYVYSKTAGRKGNSAKIKNVVDLGLMDRDGRFIGWSGSARDSVYVGAYSSTSGYLMTDISPGEWQIIVGAYKIPGEGLDVRYEIEFLPHQPRWLTGDLHIHSDASDGQYSAAVLAEKAKKAGLDFIAISNHNNYTDNLNLPVKPALTLIPAVEWTHYKGHLNFFGVVSPFENSFIANNEEDMMSLIANAKEKGALISVNHPKCRYCPYIWENDDCFDMVEVWNGPMRRDNMKAISWWHDMLMNGRKIPITSGSDYHKSFHPARLAHPVIHVFSQSPSAGDIISAVSQGHSYITSSAKGAVLDLRYDTAMMGDNAIWNEETALSITAEKVHPGCKLKLITSEGTAVEWEKFPNDELKTQVKVSKNWRFAYLILTRKLFNFEYIRVITNPIYFNK